MKKISLPFLNGKSSLRYAAQVSEIVDPQGPFTGPDVEVVLNLCAVSTCKIFQTALSNSNLLNQ